MNEVTSNSAPTLDCSPHFSNMRFLTLATAAFAITSTAAAPQPPPSPAQYPVYDALYDGKCFYPKPTSKFDLNSYLGKWYQVAGYPFGFTAGARCVTAEYSLNADGTVRVMNSAQVGGRPIGVEGAAAPAPKSYGKAGVFKVEFPGQSPPATCAGPNYIVQKYSGDFAIVQTQNWTTLFILSRDREPGQAKIDEWIKKAVDLGSDPSKISNFDQAGC